jgi:hypothetical protein
MPIDAYCEEGRQVATGCDCSGGRVLLARKNFLNTRRQKRRSTWGETARVPGKVDCVDAHRRSHILTVGGCEPKMDFYVRVPYGVPGPHLDVTELKGVVITVSGKIEKSEVDGLPFIDVTSTSQIVPHPH